MRHALSAAAALALLVVPAASANGDPASDVLLPRQVFVGPEVPLSQFDRDTLERTVADANRKGYPIRVALIAFTGDLGTAVSLWGHPQSYAKFLGSEIAFVYPKPLLVAMPSGFGVYDGKRPVAKEQRVLARLRAGKTPAAHARPRLKSGTGLPGHEVLLEAQVTCDHHPLDFVRPLPDLQNLLIPVQTRDRRLLHEAVPAVDLQGRVGRAV